MKNFTSLPCTSNKGIQFLLIHQSNLSQPRARMVTTFNGQVYIQHKKICIRRLHHAIIDTQLL